MELASGTSRAPRLYTCSNRTLASGRGRDPSSKTAVRAYSCAIAKRLADTSAGFSAKTTLCGRWQWSRFELTALRHAVGLDA